MAAWLAADGHEVQALTASEFAHGVVPDLPSHLAAVGLPTPERYQPKSRILARYMHKGVDVQFLCATGKEVTDQRAYTSHVQRITREFRPQLTVCHGDLAVLTEPLRLTKQAGSRNIVCLFHCGNEARPHFAHVDRVTTCSQFLSQWYVANHGLRAAILPHAIDVEEAFATDGPRDALLFVNPRAEFVPALQAEISRQHPFVRMVTVSPGECWHPRDFWGEAKVVVLPERQCAFGRLAIEASINGVVSLASARGGYPESVADAGVRLALPETETGVQEWVNAAARLMSHPYPVAEFVPAMSRRVAEWAEIIQRERILRFFADMKAGK